MELGLELECRAGREDGTDRLAEAATLQSADLGVQSFSDIGTLRSVLLIVADSSAMVRSTCKVVVRLKPKNDPLDTAVQCIDNTAVCPF